MTECVTWLQAKLQILTIGIIFLMFVASPAIGWGLYLYLLTTRFWWFSLVYSLWFYYDRHTPESGGRPISWIQNATVWKSCINYFPSKLTLSPGFNLDQEKNYLFCIFPHGIIPVGPYLGLLNGACKFRELHPNFNVQLVIINLMFFSPFLREWIMGLGLVSCSAKSLDYLLSRPNGGHIVNLSPGGAVEASYSQPGLYTFYVKNRKGFVKTALRSGAALVPVVTFGEVDLFQQVENQKIRFLQDFARKKFGFTPVLFYGTGIFSSFGWVPRKKPLMTVLGKPIEVSRIKDPTQQEIDDLHARFVQELVSLFDSYKDKFLDKVEDRCLVLK